MHIADHLQRAWTRRGLTACALLPLAALLGTLVRIRRGAYRRGWLTSVRLPVPVLVVGNRIVGGAGKTPTTIALLQHLQSRGWHPGVLSRGYKSHQEDPSSARILDATTHHGLTAAQTGDEPMLIWRRTGVPVAVHRDRGQAGRSLLASHPEIDILVCDDGLQHLRLQRDLEVVVFDRRGAGNGWLLPAGPLREPVDTPPAWPLKAPPLTLYNASTPSTPLRGHLAATTMRALTPLADWWAGRPPSASLTPAQGAAPHTWAVAGIAEPARFFEALQDMGYRPATLGLPDHADLRDLPWPPEATDVIVTEKDAVKLDPERLHRERPGCRVWVSALDLTPEAAFWHELDNALRALKPR
jgi:tetraacyldisaccharide 4'-kinase